MEGGKSNLFTDGEFHTEQWVSESRKLGVLPFEPEEILFTAEKCFLEDLPTRVDVFVPVHRVKLYYYYETFV